MEASWHAALLLLAARPVLGWLHRFLWARVSLACVVLAALAYHVVMVRACDVQAPLCYWRGP